MATNLAKFNYSLAAAAKKIKGDIGKFHQRVCIEAFTRIVRRTAVDTGRARGGWQIEFNKQADGQVDEGLWNTTVRRGLIKLENIPPFSVVHFTNNVEYIFYLEYSRRSPQSPDGMVEITLQELRIWLRSVK